MTPDPRSPIFIRHDIPSDASRNVQSFANTFNELKTLADKNRWPGITSQNLVLEYSTYDNNVWFIITFRDKNDHSHTLTITLQQEVEALSGIALCSIEYLFSADNFKEGVLTVRSFAEDLMLELWRWSIDAELCRNDWGLRYSCWANEIDSVIDVILTRIINRIKPMEWFYEDKPVWKFYKIYYRLQHWVKDVREKAAEGRWNGLQPENIKLNRDKSSTHITITYQEDGIYEMIFQLGLQENDFDEEATGKWFQCEYHFNLLSSDQEVRSYYLKEEKELCSLASEILNLLSYKYLFAYHEDRQGLTMVVENDWALEKFYWMLDIMMPIIRKHKAPDPLITSSIIDQTKYLEEKLGTSMEIVRDEKSLYIFNFGHFLDAQDPYIIDESGDYPF